MDKQRRGWLTILFILGNLTLLLVWPITPGLIEELIPSALLHPMRLLFFGAESLQCLFGACVGLFLLSAVVSEPAGARLFWTEVLSGINDPHGSVMVSVRTSTGSVTPARSDPMARRVWLAMIACIAWLAPSVLVVLFWALRR